ncbi:MAG TPA: M28 family peptidase, partial [Nocardioidaceae bacterium]|nr:M28 family peptidase [Nocardioidaceae bacterium]
MPRWLACCALLLALPACDADPEAEPDPLPSVSVTSPTLPTTTPPANPAAFHVATAVQAVEHLAGSIGPRHATSPAFRLAVTWTADRFRELGYDVRRQAFDVPGGNSWGVPVDSGRSANVIATTDSFRPGRPHLIVGAHLDTVPQAPGAEDNASGIGVLLAVAEAISGARTRLPVVFVAFGAEEPRGPTDLDHHYGSRHYVATLSDVQRRNLRGMVSLDRVGVGDVLPICSAASEEDALQKALLRAAARAQVDATRC